MKLYAFLFLGILMIQGAAQAADLVTSGQSGSIRYYAVSTTKSLKILLPWKVKVGLSDVGPGSGNQRYYVSLYSEIDTRLDSPDIAQVRALYPGYKIDAAIPTQLTSIQVDMGDGHPVIIAAPPTSQNFFAKNWFLDAKSGPTIWTQIANGAKPLITIQAQVTVPNVVRGETFTLPLTQLCPKTQGRDTVGNLLGELVLSLQPVYQNLQTAELKQLVLSTAIESCLQLMDGIKIESISDVLQLSANVPDRVQDITLTTDRIGTSTEASAVTTEIEISESK